jgi:hypothetical protein
MALRADMEGRRIMLAVTEKDWPAMPVLILLRYGWHMLVVTKICEVLTFRNRIGIYAMG